MHFPPDVAFNPFPWELKFIFYSKEKAEDGGFSLWCTRRVSKKQHIWTAQMISTQMGQHATDRSEPGKTVDHIGLQHGSQRAGANVTTCVSPKSR